MKTLNIRIITPDGEFYRGTLNSLKVVTLNGELTILPDHFPLVAPIVPSCLSMYGSDNKKIDASISTGLLNVKTNEVVIIADAIEFKNQINIDRAREALKRAEARLKQQNRDDIDYSRAEAALKRAMTRISVYENKD